jgi:subfamily B ATP-binding cassette protein MsbA
MKDLLRLLRYVRPYIGRILVAAVSAIFLSGTFLGIFSLIQPITDGMSKGDTKAVATAGKFQLFEQIKQLAPFATWVQESSAGTVILAVCAVVALFFVKGFFQYLTAYFTRWAGLQAIRDLRIDLYAQMQNQSLAFFSLHPTGGLISRVLNDVGRLQRTVSGDLAEVMKLGAIIAGQAAWIFYLNWRLATFSLVLIPLLVYPVARFGRRLKETSHRSMKNMGEATIIMKEGLSGTRVVQAFGMERFEIGRFTSALQRVQRAEKKAARLLSVAPPVMDMIGAVCGGILLTYAAHRIAAGKLTLGELATIITVLFMIWASIKNLVRISNTVAQASAAAQRVFEILDRPQEVIDRPGAVELPPFNDRIELSDVGFGYGDRLVLSHVDVMVPKGQVVALVGSSGVGKSSLVNLLPRFYDVTSGAVMIDGRDVRDVTLASLRRQIGLVTQEVILFDDTVRNNIAYGSAEVSMERIVAAARAAHAHGFIEKLPSGYETPLGEAGHRLSLGQRQRLSIARAILKGSPILILDEATSSLDSESEAEVQRALHNLMEGRTVFVIAHRLSTVRRADVILVMESGRIIDRGTHVELLARPGVYARLHALQFRGENGPPEASVL